MLNRVMLIGNLGRDPEVRSTPSGQTVATFSLATSRRWKDRKGNRQEETEWHQIVTWGKVAEIVGQYLHKGKQVYVEGRIQTRSWDDRQTGEKKYRTEIVCESLVMLGQRGDAQSSGNEGGQSRRQASANSGPPPSDSSDYGPFDDDIPF